ARRISPRVRRWLAVPFASRKRRFVVALIVVVLPVSIYLFFWLAPDADAQAGLVTKIDSKGNPIIRNGRVIQFTGRPAEGGNYRVSLGKRRYFILHLPDSYKDDPQNPLPVLSLLHGDHQEDPLEWARDCAMNQYADRDRFIAVYPAAQ